MCTIVVSQESSTVVLSLPSDSIRQPAHTNNNKYCFFSNVIHFDEWIVYACHCGYASLAVFAFVTSASSDWHSHARIICNFYNFWWIWWVGAVYSVSSLFSKSNFPALTPFPHFCHVSLSDAWLWRLEMGEHHSTHLLGARKIHLFIIFELSEETWRQPPASTSTTKWDYMRSKWNQWWRLREHNKMYKMRS